MQFKTVVAAALSAALVSAQNNSLTAVLNSTSELSTLNTILSENPDVLTVLGGLSNITLFAPSNSALDPLISSPGFNATASQPNFIASFLEYHVVKGRYNSSAFTTTPKFLHTYLNDTYYTNVTGGQVVELRLVDQNATVISGLKSVATVTTANVNVSNGIVHIIDNYLTIPPNATDTALDAGLTAFAGALEATNLSSTIDAASDVTIFAPTNAAFQDIANILANLTTAEATSILEYHVINGTVAYSALLGNTSVTALSGGKLNVTVEDGAVFIDSARVIGADILVSGGVVHVIDAVLNPNGTATPDPSASTPVPAYAGATSGSEAPFTSLATATTTNSALTSTAADVASGYTAAASGDLSAAGSSATKAASSSSSAGAAPTAVVGAMGAAALFGGAAFLL